MSAAADREIGSSNRVQQEIEDDNLVVNNDFYDEDNVSIASESSIGSDIVATPNVNVNLNIQRRRRNQLDQLGPADANLQRLRPRHR